MRYRIWVLVGVLVLITGGAGGAVALNEDHSRPNGTPAAPVPTVTPTTTDPAAYPPTDTTTEQAADSTTEFTAAPTTEPVTTAPDPELVAEQALERYREGDLARLSFDGRWVAQLASKEPGITDPVTGQTYDLAAILAEHEALRLRGDLGDVFLLRTTDYGTSYQGPVLWVTFADPGAGSARAVRDWCASRFPALTGDALVNACAPRHLRSR